VKSPLRGAERDQPLSRLPNPHFKRRVLNAGTAISSPKTLRPLRRCLVRSESTFHPSAKPDMSSKLAPCLVALLAALLSACGTPAAKDFGGSWKPVNRFEDKTTEIPLAVPYTYYAAPMDGTLKTMLSRWTADNGMKLQYKLRSDFTLTKAASAIHTTELRDAASQLSTIYGPQGVAVLVSGPEVVVEEVSAITTPPATQGTAPQAAVTTVSSTGTKPVAASAVAN
jgi:hypothetical protein